MCIAIIIFPVDDIIDFKINFSFLYQAFVLHELPESVSDLGVGF